MAIYNDLPILIIAFNRVEITRSLIESLREIAPRQLFYSVDGPKQNNDQDLQINQQMRELVSTIDWPCSVETLFSESNYGSGLWPYKSISWALSKSEKILILEDDVRITHTFYEISVYCLNKFEDDKEVFAICASNISDTWGSEKSYQINSSKYFAGWGWAIWADRWDDYKFKIDESAELSFFSLLKLNNLNFLISSYFWINFYRIKHDYINAWDYQINYLLFITNMKVLKPDRNLSTNIGIGASATHTKKMPEIKLNYLPFDVSNLNINLFIDSKKERLWRKYRLRFLIKSLWLKLYI
jgi:hypothetical protein